MTHLVMSRRRAVAAMAGLALGAEACAIAGGSIRAVAFDAFTLFDPRPVSAAAELCFPGRGVEFVNAWRARQFEYTWLRTITGHYADFWRVTEDALVFAAALLNLRPTSEQQALLMRSFLELAAWPDSLTVLERLKASGIRLVLLSNFTLGMLDAAVERHGMAALFEARLSTDRVRAYKPDSRAYRMAVNHFKLTRPEIAFAAFAGWDAAGAEAFGYPTFWVNRMRLPEEKLGRSPDGAGASLQDLARFVLGA